MILYLNIFHISVVDMMRRGTNKRIGKGRPPRLQIIRNEHTPESSQAENTTTNVGDTRVEPRQQSHVEMPLLENAALELPIALEDRDLENHDNDSPMTRGPYRRTPLPTDSANRMFLRVIGDRFVV